MTQRVFLSYSMRDKKLVASIERELKKLNVSTYNPTNLKPGAEWRKSITEAIRKSDSVVVFVTEPNAPSSWIGYEVGSASALGKQVLVAKSNSLSASDLPTDLSAWQMVDFDPSSPSKTARTLASSLAVAA
jgi:hypothetical protein